MPLSPEKVQDIHGQVDRVRRISDRLVGIGPFGVGLDGVLGWVPGLGPFVDTGYSAAVGAFLLAQAARVGASGPTIGRMIAYLGFDTLLSANPVPILGPALDTLFQGHLLAAGALLKDIERRHPHIRPIRLAGPARAPKFRPAR